MTRTPIPDDFEQLTGAFDTRIAPSPAFANRLRQRVHAEAGSIAESVPAKPALPALMPAATSREEQPAIQEPPAVHQRRIRRSLRPAWFGSFETAAVAILVFALVFGAIYSLQREPSSNNHGSQIVASPDATPESTANEVNWGGDAGHSWWQQDLAVNPSTLQMTQLGEASAFADRMSMVAIDSVFVTMGMNKNPQDIENQGKQLQAFDFKTMTLLWSKSIAVEPAMAMDQERIYAVQSSGSGNEVPKVHLVAISVATGEIVWTGPELYGNGYRQFSAGPVLRNGVVYVADEFGSTFAVKSSDGSTLWESPVSRTDVPEQSGRLSNTPTGGVIALTDDAVFVSSWFNTIRKLDSGTGAELNTFTTPSGTQRLELQAQGDVPIVSAERPRGDSTPRPSGTYDLGQPYDLLAMNAGDGTVLWSHEIVDLPGNVAVGTDRVIVPVRDDPEAPIRLATFGLRDGVVKEVAMEPIPTRSMALSATGDGDTPLLFVAQSNDGIRVIDVSSGKTVLAEDATASSDNAGRPLSITFMNHQPVFVTSDGRVFSLIPGSK